MSFDQSPQLIGSLKQQAQSLFKAFLVHVWARTRRESANAANAATPNPPRGAVERVLGRGPRAHRRRRDPSESDG